MKKIKFSIKGVLTVAVLVFAAMTSLFYAKVQAAEMTIAPYEGKDYMNPDSQAHRFSNFLPDEAETISFSKVSESEYNSITGDGVIRLNFDDTLKFYMSGTEGRVITTCDRISLPSQSSHLFEGCIHIKEINGMNMLDTSNVQSMLQMFQECEALEQIDLSGFDTKRVTNMSGMFNWCSSLTSIDLSGFDTSNLEALTFMFSECGALKDLNLEGFNTRNIKSFSSMFTGCRSLESLNLSSFEINEDLSSIYCMFESCTSLKYLDISSLDIRNIGDVAGMNGAFTGIHDCKIVVGPNFKNNLIPNFGDNIREIRIYNLGDNGEAAQFLCNSINEAGGTATTVNMTGISESDEYERKVVPSDNKVVFSYVKKGTDEVVIEGTLSAYVLKTSYCGVNQIPEFRITGADSLKTKNLFNIDESLTETFGCDTDGNECDVLDVGDYELKLKVFGAGNESYEMWFPFEVSPLHPAAVYTKDQRIGLDGTISNDVENVEVDGLASGDYVKAVELELGSDNLIILKKLVIFNSDDEDVTSNYYFDDVIVNGMGYPLEKMEGVKVSGCNVLVDGKEHKVTVTGAPEDAIYSYSLDGKTFSSKEPTFKEPGIYEVTVRIEKEDYVPFEDKAKVIIENYKVLEGEGSIWTEGLGTRLVIRGNGEISDFVKAVVDGKDVDPSNYVLTEGSTIITFKDAYLKTLAEGKHVLEMVWKYGSVKVNFTVKHSGDVPAGNAVPVVLAVALLAGAGGVVFFARKRKITA